MRRWERFAADTAVDEGSDFRLVRGAKAIDELGQRLLVVAHAERTEGKGLFAATAAICLHDNVERFLIEPADLDLAFLSEENCLHAIAGDVVARHLNLRH